MFVQALDEKVSVERKDLQKLVDNPILNTIKSVPYLKTYLEQKFALSKNDKPHELKF